MYKQFVKNFNTFLSINACGQGEEDYRVRVAMSLLPLTDIALFQKCQYENPPLYDELKQVLSEISRQQTKYPEFKAFSWELWAYGFDGATSEHELDREKLDLQLKLIQLFLGTQYWQ